MPPIRGYIELRCIVSNACGSVTSDTRSLTTSRVPVSDTQPQPATACAGSDATFSVVVDFGALETLEWQWREAGEPDFRAVAVGPNFNLNGDVRFSTDAADLPTLNVQEVTSGSRPRSASRRTARRR